MFLLLYLIPILLVVMAQILVNSSYTRYLDIMSKKGYSGEMVARMLLERNNINEVDVSIIEKGIMSDFYDPRLKTIRLSNDVYYGNSILSIAVAAHEVGHAIQDDENYGFLSLRNRVLPYVNIACRLGWISLIFGFLFSSNDFLNAGIILLIAMSVFQLVTLPIELDASKRALLLLSENNIIVEEEKEEVSNMLKATAFTYIASLASSILYLIRVIMKTNNKINK